MSSLAEIFRNPNATFLIGLALGLWAAANVWIYRYACGFQAGVKYCTEQLEPLKAELVSIGPASFHHVSEEMRQRMKEALAPDGETAALSDDDCPHGHVIGNCAICRRVRRNRRISTGQA